MPTNEKRVKISKRRLLLLASAIVTLVYSVSDSIGFSIPLADDQMLNILSQIISILCLLGVVSFTCESTEMATMQEDETEIGEGK